VLQLGQQISYLACSIVWLAMVLAKVISLSYLGKRSECEHPWIDFFSRDYIHAISITCGNFLEQTALPCDTWLLIPKAPSWVIYIWVFFYQIFPCLFGTNYATLMLVKYEWKIFEQINSCSLLQLMKEFFMEVSKCYVQMLRTKQGTCVLQQEKSTIKY